MFNENLLEKCKKAKRLVDEGILEECDFYWIYEVGNTIAEGIKESYFKLGSDNEFEKDDLRFIYDKLYSTTLGVLDDEEAKSVALEIIQYGIYGCVIEDLIN